MKFKIEHCSVCNHIPQLERGIWNWTAACVECADHYVASGNTKNEALEKWNSEMKNRHKWKKL